MAKYIFKVYGDVSTEETRIRISKDPEVCLPENNNDVNFVSGENVYDESTCLGDSVFNILKVVTGASVHAPRHRNGTYVQTFIRSIYKTRLP